MRNIEIKAYARNLQLLIKNVRFISKSDGQIIKQHDTFFKVPQGRLKLRKFEEGNAELIYYERPDTEGPKLSSFEKTNISKENVDSLCSVLAKALGTTVIVKKVRQLFLVDQTRIHVDSVEGLGDFLEFEVVLRPDQSPEDGEKIAFDLMKQLEVKEEDLISTAYADLLNR
ncbi:uncharacterized protein LOC108905400 [Anoplophora glabripennis]|uniref:uncharacterized protein LOC108905400 n=1 Tax=Anoplophora glabripennis TaxID=217634 RepID=UPI0008749C52|nr:uncharacterized protein LOC108905400 [Anoplophora glabripennis]